MSEDEDKPLVKREKKKGEIAEKIEDEMYEPVYELEPKEQRYALKKVTSTLSDGEIAKSLGLSDYQRRKIEKKDAFQNYINQLQKRYSDKEIVESERRQMRYIREQMFEEAASRFRDPKEAAKEHFGTTEEGYIDANKDEKERFMERFAHNARFKDLINALKKIDKMRRLDEGQATDVVDASAIENRARESFQELREGKARKSFFDEKAEEAISNGVDDFEEFKAKVIDAEYEEIDEEDIKEKETKKSNKDSKSDENSDDEIMSEFEIEN